MQLVLRQMRGPNINLSHVKNNWCYANMSDTQLGVMTFLEMERQLYLHRLIASVTT